MNGLRYFDGKVFDGYIRGAEVFVDTNDNLNLDASEASVTTDNQGSFTKLLFGDGTLVSKGGFDLDTGADLANLTLVHKLEGYEASKLVSPFTTLIAYMSDASTINAALGIDASIDLLTTDPIPNLGEDIYNQMYEKGNQLTVLSYTLQNHSNAVDSTSALYFQAIADQLEESYAANQAVVDIEDPTFISNVIDKVETARDTTFSPDVKANLNTVLSSTIPLLKVYADTNITSSVQRFAFSTLQNDVKDSTVMIGNASPTLLKYENNVFEYVASDQGIDESIINPINNNAPTISSSTTFSVAENQTAIGSVTASDDDGDSLTYSISGSEISISSTGVLFFVAEPDYETKNSYTAIVTVGDGTDSVTQSITVTITDVDETVPNEAPTISSSATFSANENQTSIGSVSASDADGDSLTYSISGSEINISSSGVLTFASAPDYETKNSYTATVTVSDGINSTTQNITVDVTDVDETVPNEAPTISSSATFSANENQTSIGSVSASDADGDSLTYSISGSEINISSSGVLTFASAPDYETKNSYTATVTVSDGINSTTQNITVNVTDVAENVAPTISGLASSITVAENQTSVVTVSASDGNGDTLSYSLSGTDASSLSINSSGVISFDSAPDYETKNSYSVTVNVSDASTTASQAITVNISNVNEAPTISSLASSISVVENYSTVVTVSVADPESQSISYSLSGTDASSLSISSSGAITFNSPPDYETKTSYSIAVNVSDGSNSVSQSITINISNIVETGTSGNDTINGGPGADTIKGLGGNDTINGGGGNDILRGGYGVDILNGEDGDDILSDEECYQGFTIPFDDITSCDSDPSGVSGQDIDGGAGNDTIYAQATNATILGGSGNDTIYAIQSFGNSITEQGVPLNGKIDGGDGNDVIRQVGGDSFVYGGAGNDTFYPGSGMDRFVGGDGVDKIYIKSGEGSGSWDNVSMFLDFVDGEDKIIFEGGYQSFNDLTVYTSFPGDPSDKSNYDSLNGTKGPCNNTRYIKHVNSGSKALLIICSASASTIDSDDFE